MGFEKRKTARANILTQQEMDTIHEKALYMLENTGIRVEHAEGMDLLEKAGALVDRKTEMVKMPKRLVEESLKKVPRTITMAARNPEKDVVLEPMGRMYSRNTGGMAEFLDIETGKIRDARLEDVAAFTKLADALPNPNLVAPVYAMDVPIPVRELTVLQTMLRNTDKHVNIRALKRENLDYIAEIGVTLAGGKENLRKRPIISILEAPVQPLRFVDVYVDSLKVSAEYGIPLEVCSMPIIGATGPITFAGCLLLTTIEHLATIVVAQLFKEGAPIIWAPRYVMMDMASGLSWSTVEVGLLFAASAQMASEYYHMVCDLHGPGTNALEPGAESIYESTFDAFTTGFTGPTILCGAGALELGLIASLEQLVIDNDVFTTLERALAGFEINEELMAADVISAVGAGGNFLGEDHTLKHLRQDHHRSLLLKPKTRDKWVAEGSKGIRQVAKEQALGLLAKHETNPLDEKMDKEIDSLISRVKKEKGLE